MSARYESKYEVLMVGEVAEEQGEVEEVNRLLE